MTEPVNIAETVKRYVIHYDGRGEQEHPSGDFVHYESWKANFIKLNAANKRIEQLEDQLESALSETRRAKDENLKLERTMVEATKDSAELREILGKLWKHTTSDYVNKNVKKAVKEQLEEELKRLNIL